MAAIQNNGGSGSRKTGNRRRLRLTPTVDMTPMVDLGFLLITFFMLSMQMHKPIALTWVKQKETPEPEAIPECCVLNILMDSVNHVFIYEGGEVNKLKPVNLTGAKGLTQAIEEKNKKIIKECGLTKAGKPHKLICMIKLLPNARYQNLTDIIDEMNITHTAAYSIQEPLSEELAAVQIQSANLLAKR